MSKGRWMAGGCLGITVLACAGTGGLVMMGSRAVGAVQAAGVACDGQPVPGAAAYVPGAAQHVVGFERQSSGVWSYAGTMIPHAWADAESADEATLVFCFDEDAEEAAVESCSYDGGTVVRRVGYTRRTQLVEASTGRLVRELAMPGGAPAPCPESVALGGGGGGVSVRVLGIPVTTVGEDPVLPTERVQEGAEPERADVQTAFGDLVH